MRKFFLLAALLFTAFTSEAALRTLPYKVKISSHTISGSQFIVTEQILDGTNAVVNTLDVSIGSGYDYGMIRQAIEAPVIKQMSDDGVDAAGLLNGLDGKTITINQ